MTIGELLVKVGADPSGLQGLQQSLNQAGEELTGFADEAKVAGDALDAALSAPMQDASAQMNLFADSIGEVASAAGEIGSIDTSGIDALDGAISDAAEKIPELNDNLHEIKPAAEEAENSLGELGEKLLELGGIALTLEALKEAITSTLEAFGEFQRAGEALTALTGDAKEAAEALERLPALADALGQSIPSLEAAQQKFHLFGVELGQIPELLTSVSDASRASLQPFDDVASAFERMDNTGKLAARTLQTTGLSMGDIAKAMNMVGASDAEITKAFADLGTGAEGASARADVLIDATQRLQGISKSTANDVMGSWQQISNAVHEAAVNIGEALSAFGGAGGVELFKTAIKGVETFIVALIGYAVQAEDIIVGLGKVAVDVFMSIGRAAASAASGNWAQAWEDIKTGWSGVLSDLHDTGQKMVDDWQANGKLIDKIWDDTGTNVEASTHKHVQGASSDITNVTEELLKLSQQVIDLLNKIPATEDAYLTQLQAGGEKATQMLSQINTALDKAMKDMGNLTLTPQQIDAIQKWIDLLNQAKITVQGFVATDDIEKLGDKIQKLADKFPEQVAEMGPAIQLWISMTEQMGQSMKKAKDDTDPAAVLENLLQMQKDVDDIAASMTKSWAGLDQSIGKPLTLALQEVGAFTTQTNEEVKSIGKNWMDVAATVQTSGAQQGVVYAALKALKIDDVSLDQQQLTALGGVLAIMQRMGAPLSEQLAIKAQMLQDELKIGLAQGATADQALNWTQQLTVVQTQMGVIRDQTMGLSNLYTNMVKAFSSAWSDLGKGLGDAIAEWHGFGDAVTQVWDNLKKQVAEFITQYLLGQLKDALLQNTNLLGDFNKVFTSIFGGAGGAGTMSVGFDAAKQASDVMAQQISKDFSNTANAAADAGQKMSSSMQQTATSVSQSASTMMTGLSAIGSIVSAIAGVFSAIELMHTNTLLDRIEHETARMAIYLGDSGSNSIQFYTGKTVEMLGYINGYQDQIKNASEQIVDVLTSILNILATGGGVGGSGSGGMGAAAYAALQKEITGALEVFKEEITGPYGLGDSIQGVATGAAELSSSTGDLSSSFSDLSTSTGMLASTITSATTQTAAAVQTMAAAVQTVSNPALVVPGPSNSITPYLSPAAPAGGPAGPGGSNTLVSVASPNAVNNPSIHLSVTVSGNNIGSPAAASAFADQVMQQAVKKLRSVAGLKL